MLECSSRDVSLLGMQGVCDARVALFHFHVRLSTSASLKNISCAATQPNPSPDDHVKSLDASGHFVLQNMYTGDGARVSLSDVNFIIFYQ